MIWPENTTNQNVSNSCLWRKTWNLQIKRWDFFPRKLFSHVLHKTGKFYSFRDWQAGKLVSERTLSSTNICFSQIMKTGVECVRLVNVKALLIWPTMQQSRAGILVLSFKTTIKRWQTRVSSTMAIQVSWTYRVLSTGALKGQALISVSREFVLPWK